MLELDRSDQIDLIGPFGTERPREIPYHHIHGQPRVAASLRLVDVAVGPSLTVSAKHWVCVSHHVLLAYVKPQPHRQHAAAS